MDNRLRRLTAPLAVAAAAVAACGTVLVADPNDAGSYPPCPYLLLTGRWCPGCGGLRAARALLNGDVAAAADLNLLFVVAVPWLVYAWLAWAASCAGGPSLGLGRIPRWLWWSVIAVVPAFWVLRNIPVGPLAVLAP